MHSRPEGTVPRMRHLPYRTGWSFL